MRLSTIASISRSLGPDGVSENWLSSAGATAFLSMNSPIEDFKVDVIHAMRDASHHPMKASHWFSSLHDYVSSYLKPQHATGPGIKHTADIDRMYIRSPGSVLLHQNIDNDHVSGFLRWLLQKPFVAPSIKRIFFNNGRDILKEECQAGTIGNRRIRHKWLIQQFLQTVDGG